jgi:hypothetical protein
MTLASAAFNPRQQHTRWRLSVSATSRRCGPVGARRDLLRVECARLSGFASKWRAVHELLERRPWGVADGRGEGARRWSLQACRATFDTRRSGFLAVESLDGLPRAGRHIRDLPALCASGRSSFASEPQFVRRPGDVVIDPPLPGTLYSHFFWRQAQWVYLCEECRISPD